MTVRTHSWILGLFATAAASVGCSDSVSGPRSTSAAEAGADAALSSSETTSAVESASSTGGNESSESTSGASSTAVSSSASDTTTSAPAELPDAGDASAVNTDASMGVVPPDASETTTDNPTTTDLATSSSELGSAADGGPGIGDASSSTAVATFDTEPKDGGGVDSGVLDSGVLDTGVVDSAVDLDSGETGPSCTPPAEPLTDGGCGIPLSAVLPSYLEQHSAPDGGVADGACFPPCIDALLEQCPRGDSCVLDYVQEVICWDNGVMQTPGYSSEGATEALTTGNGARCLHALRVDGDPKTLTWVDGVGTVVATGTLEQPYPYSLGMLQVTCAYDGNAYPVDLDGDPDCATVSDTSWRVSDVCDYGGTCP